jgi:predicted transcriptional regulator
VESQKAEITYKINFSYTQLKEYVMYLQRHELVNRDAESRVFRSTTKGRKVLELYNEMTELTSGLTSEKFKT